jgi:hypothetical protein
MRVDEPSALDALLILTNAISGTTHIETIYEAALDCLEQALPVRRASILLFDADGVMRFRAARNVSAAYQRAVEGHTPWQPHATRRRFSCPTSKTIRRSRRTSR